MSYKDKFEQNGYHISPEENVDIKIHEITALFIYLQEKWLEKAIESAAEKCSSSAQILKSANAETALEQIKAWMRKTGEWEKAKRPNDKWNYWLNMHKKWKATTTDKLPDKFTIEVYGENQTLQGGYS